MFGVSGYLLMEWLLSASGLFVSCWWSSVDVCLIGGFPRNL